MRRVAIAFTTKDRVELTKRSIEPLLQPDKFDLWWFDGSDTQDGKNLYWRMRDASTGINYTGDVKGGADAAIVCALTSLLQFTIPANESSPAERHVPAYDYIGLVENDVLLHQDWFEPTMALFERGKVEGLCVGAVSARAYQDRILIQRDGYAAMHNLGAGMVILTRQAAQLLLDYFRTGFTTDNRLLFSQLSGVDIGRYWAFRGSEHMITADWHFDAVLAAHGLASLALTPSPVEMIGQLPSLEAQGLQIADGKFDLLNSDEAFQIYSERLALIRGKHFKPAFHRVYCHIAGGFTYFPHQMSLLGAKAYGLWNLKWAQGFGPFAWRAGHIDGRTEPEIAVPVVGPCTVLVSGGANGGKVFVKDLQSNYDADVELAPEDRMGTMSIAVPGNFAYRNIRIKATTPGVIFYGIRTVYEQPECAYTFDWNRLPPV